MAKVATLDFNNEVLQALRENKLVVFAGAGVSMGPPSSLPNFEELAKKISEGTNYRIEKNEPADRFLGKLQYNSIDVKAGAVENLTRTDSKPNSLHKDLLRLFRTKENVRLVTTNFDRHFESAAKDVFQELPAIYRAPALPLGRDFGGIVYIHGSVDKPKEIVLTDADFGQAYLTDVWACRFLLDLFQNYTVLFVGYSHTDVVMNYLSRALPPESRKTRFIITDDNRNWDINGITPILFRRGIGAKKYAALYGGVHKLAEIISRDALNWKMRLAEIGRGAPPIDEETIGEIELALAEEHTTHFLLNTARGPEWSKWFDEHKYLDGLFQSTELNCNEVSFAYWLAKNFAVENPDVIFEMMTKHGSNLNYVFWEQLCRAIISRTGQKAPQKHDFERWLTVLLANVPNRIPRHIMMNLAESSVQQGTIYQALQIFLLMGEPELTFKHGLLNDQLSISFNYPSNEQELSRIWNQLYEHISSVAQQFIVSFVQQTDKMHETLAVWEKTSRVWDPYSYRRSAIEPHEQDQYMQPEDVMLNAARDSLEWIAANNEASLNIWIEKLVASDSPLLRRLAIHAVTINKGMSSDERIEWLLDHIDIFAIAEHHEIYRAVELNISRASANLRDKFVDTVMARPMPAEEDKVDSAEYAQFNWLSWLLKTIPDSERARDARASIICKHPEWQIREHPDFTHWSFSRDGLQSPWTVDQLLEMNLNEKLEELIKFSGNRFEGPGRHGMLEVIKEASKRKIEWALSLAKLLIERSLWTSDLWPALIRGLQESELSFEDWKATLTILAVPDLIEANAEIIANFIFALVKNEEKPWVIDLLPQANDIADKIWKSSVSSKPDNEIDDWLQFAINHEGGVITEFWLNSLSILLHGKSGADRVMPEDYKSLLTRVMQDQTIKGGLGRCFLASQAAYLFHLDEPWTCKFIIPLFSDMDHDNFKQAWDGFLAWGRLDPPVAEALQPAFLYAAARLDTDLHENRERFIEYYTTVAVYYVEDPTKKFIPNLFRNCSVNDRVVFAQHLGFCLRIMEPDAINNLWKGWLCHYWQRRLKGIPVKIEETEIPEMLEWLVHLGDLYPEAVKLTISFGSINFTDAAVLFELQESDLVLHYPNETAKLLIYLSNHIPKYYTQDLIKVAERLTDLPHQLKHELDERIARLG